MRAEEYTPAVVADQLARAITKMQQIEKRRIAVRRDLAEALEELYLAEKKTYESLNMQEISASKMEMIRKYKLLPYKYKTNKLKADLAGLNGEWEYIEAVNNNLKKLSELMK